MPDMNTIICMVLFAGAGALMIWGARQLLINLKQLKNGECKEPLFVESTPGKRMRKLKEM